MGADATSSESIQNFARRVLTSAELADKLRRPASLHWQVTRGDESALPDQPARSAAIDFLQGQPLPALTRNAAQSPAGRIALLHSFANHELLALELLALAVLKYPDQPLGFYRYLGRTMLDEQRHCQLYCQRLQDLGSQFGEYERSAYFWQALHQAPTPQVFVAQMALTLEQANLDFARDYEALFRQAGDPESAEILATVLRDEIGHVSHGYQWFEKMRPGEEPLFEEYRASLIPPMTATRGRGPRFDLLARQAAGLPPEFVQQMRVQQASRGRRPDVWSFDLAGGLRGLRADQNSVLAARARDLLPAFALTVPPEDLLIHAEQIAPRFRQEFADRGIGLPETVPPDLGSETSWGEFHPWAADRSALSWAAQHHQRWTRRPRTQPQGLFCKLRWRQRAEKLSADLGPALPWRAIGSQAQLEEFCQQRLDRGERVIVVKRRYTAGGHGQMRVIDADISDATRQWLADSLAEDHMLLAEVWVERIADFSFLLDTSRNDPVLGWSRFYCDRRGRYLGHELRGHWRDLPTDARELVAGQLPQAKRMMQAMGRRLRANGFTGPAGVDGFVYRRRDGQWGVQWLGECNARRTMGHVARDLAKRLQIKGHGLFLHVGRDGLRHWQQAGLLRSHEFVAAAQELSVLSPAQWSASGALVDGSLIVAEPENLQQVMPLLLLGESAEHPEIRRWLQAATKPTGRIAKALATTGDMSRS